MKSHTVVFIAKETVDYDIIIVVARWWNLEVGVVFSTVISLSAYEGSFTLSECESEIYLWSLSLLSLNSKLDLPRS